MVLGCEFTHDRGPCPHVAIFAPLEEIVAILLPKKTGVAANACRSLFGSHRPCLFGIALHMMVCVRRAFDGSSGP